ncbi:MAG: YigZ family protein [Salinirussus sp.]
MAERYCTVADEGHAIFTERGSRFIAHATPITDVEDAEKFIEAVQAEYPDASHTVPAYRVRPRHEYCDDDGEPSGSAGRPVLNVLRQEGIENVGVVVIRYFGGTELGIGGLSRAYSRVAREAVADAGIVERIPREQFTVVVDYDDSGTVRSVLESAGAEFEAEYAEQVTVKVTVPAEEADTLRERLRSATHGRARLSGECNSSTGD